MSMAIWLLVTAGFVYLIIKAIRCSAGADGKISESGSMICTNCGTRGEPKTMTKGSIWMEIILWICFLIPGLIYSFWRMTSRFKACPSCGLPNMINVNSPNGRVLAEKVRS